MKFLLRLNAALLVLALSLTLVSPAFAATRVVDNTGACDDITVYCTIAAAVLAADPGDTISVAAGTYLEGLILINKSLTLTGDPGDALPGPGPSAPVVDGQDLYTDAFLIANGTSNVTIQGFEIQNYATLNAGSNGEGNAVQAWVNGTDHITVNDNYMHDLDWGGVLVGNDNGGAVGHSYWTVARNILTDFGPDAFDTIAYGLEVSDATHVLIEDNVVDAGTGHPGTGILINFRAESGEDIVIQRNEIRGEYDFAGINVQASTEYSPASQLDNVQILDNDVEISGAAFAAVQIRNKLSGTVTNTTVRGNRLIHNGAGFGLRNWNGAETINAIGNWWDSADGPSHLSNTYNVPTQGETVSDGADFVPWLDAAPPGGVDFAPVTNGALNYSSFAAAEDDATPGDTINLAAGTFDEGRFVIDQDLTIVGVPGTIIRPNADINGGTAADAWFLINAGITFNLSDVTLDGNGSNVRQALRNHGYTTVDNVDFTNIKTTESAYFGNAVSSYGGIVSGGGGSDSHGGGGGPASTLTVENSSFTEIGRIGVLVKGTLASAEINDNSYEGKGAGDWLDYAFEAGAGAEVSIDGNMISDNTGLTTNDGSTSAGILVTDYYGPGTEATITNNTISDNTSGVVVGYDGDDESVVTAHGNSFSGNVDFGISSTNPLVDATGNDWGDASGPFDDSTVPDDCGLADDNPAGTGDAVSGCVSYTPWTGMVPGAPVLVSPVNEAMLMDYTPTFDWEDKAGATSYRFQVSLDPEFGTRVVDEDGITDSTFTLSENLAAKKTYYWRVRGINVDDVAGPWSLVQSFSTTILPPELVAPADNALLTDRTPQLKWGLGVEAAAVTGYVVQVSKDAGFTDLVVDVVVKAKTYNIPANLEAGTTYWWRVRVNHNPYGPGDWSAVRTFREAYLKPKLQTPAQNAVLSDRTPSFNWFDSSGATGYQIQISSKANFSKLLTNADVATSDFTQPTNLAKKGQFFWRVRATGPNGPSEWSAVWHFRITK